MKDFSIRALSANAGISTDMSRLAGSDPGEKDSLAVENELIEVPININVGIVVHSLEVISTTQNVYKTTG